MKRFLLALSLAAFASGAAIAQPNPIVQNYRAYMAALERGDRAGAEAPAAAALEASQTRDGDGGQTAVLALNLARLRLALTKYAEAVEPASLAARVVQTQGAASGVDPLLAQIVLGRAELGANRRSAGVHLQAALVAANGRRDLDDDAYSAATELGRWAYTSEYFDVMRTAYESALDHVAAAPGDPALARGVTRAALGTAIMLSQRRITSADARRAYATLTDAMRELWPLAQQDGSNGELTVAQNAFARAMAWQSLARARGDTDAVDGDVQNQIGVVGCHYHIDHAAGDHTSFYPRNARNRGEEGVVVIRALFDTEGHVTRAQAAAAAPDEEFGTSGEALVQTLQIVRNQDSAPNCVMPHQRFIVLHFRFG